LPVSWMGVADTFRSHERKTHKSMTHPEWCNGWQFTDNGHLAVFMQGKKPIVEVDLFGVEDQAAMERLKAECTGLWFDEAAPSTVAESHGISENAWELAITSQRVDSHAYPAICTTNYPEDDHWSWQRFIERQTEKRKSWRIPPGERASTEYRARIEAALEGNEAMLDRTVRGRPATMHLGPQVAHDFDEEAHVSETALEVHQNEPILMGWDGGHTPVCIVGQDWRGELRIYAALTNLDQKTGTRQLAENHVIPWFAKNAPWAMRDTHWRTSTVDPSMNTAEQADIEQNPVDVIHRVVGGWVEAGPVKWAPRYEPLITVLGRRGGLTIDKHGEGCDLLIKALRGRWYFPQDRFGHVTKDGPKKPNHPWEDLGDAMCYFIARCRPSRTQYDGIRMPKVVSDYNPMGRYAQDKPHVRS
jgi:hypothetical protein